MKAFIKILLLSGLVLHAGAMEKKGKFKKEEVLEIKKNTYIRDVVAECKDKGRIKKVRFPKYVTKKMVQALYNFKNVKEVDFRCCSGCEEGALALLPKELETLNLGWCCMENYPSLVPFNNDFIKPIRNYSQLKDLNISRLNIDDKALQFVPKSVIKLDLTRTNITDEGVAYISKNFPGLVELGLTGCKITDKSLLCLVGLKNLKVLIIEECKQLTDKKLEEFFEAHSYINPNLVELAISSNNVTDDVLEQVSKFKNLTFLNLCRLPDITNEGLKYFSGHKKLCEIGVYESPKISPAKLDCNTSYIRVEKLKKISFLKE